MADCCPTNPADYTSAEGAGKGYDSVCEPLPRVLFEPLSGTRIIMPSLVALRSDNPGAHIHYTTDGSAPNRDSPEYTGPITVDSPADIIRAIAVVQDCPVGPESNAQYLQWSPAANWTYTCPTVDKAGQWAAFAADGSPDYNWKLDIQFTAITGIKTIDILQLFSDGRFTGSAWSTKEFIFPWEDDATKEHRAFPLVMWNPDHTGAQVNVAYQDDFSAAYGNFGIGSHVRTLYGQPWTALPTNHLFKLRITFQDASYIERLIDTTCDVPPPALCPVPSFDSAGFSCGPPKKVDLVYILGIGTAWKIFRATSPAGPFTERGSGVVAASPETFSDPIDPEQDYYYYIANIPAGCSDYVNSIVYTITGLQLPDVSISANPTLIGAGQTSTISWTSANISGNVTITPTIGAQPGNVPGNQVVAPAVTTVYTIQGANFCGDLASAQVTVTVEQVAVCISNLSFFRVHIVNYLDFFFNVFACEPLLSSASTPWNGTMIRPSTACLWVVPFASSIQNRFLSTIRTKVEFQAGAWVTEVWMRQNAFGDEVLMWKGTKAFGDNPLGIYTRTAGCSSTPSQLIMELA